MRKTWSLFLEILFPPACLGCRAYLTSDTQANLLCPDCVENIKIYSNIFYPDSRFSLLAISSYENSALRELLHYFKYNGFLAAQVPIEKLILKWLNINHFLASSILDSSFCLAPIPLHPSRLRKRGFNQAEVIAGFLGKHLNLPIEKDILERTRDTKSQIKMKGAKEREANVKNSIVVRERVGRPRYDGVILVDDVYTSGSTIKEAARALRQADVKNITAFVIAKA